MKKRHFDFVLALAGILMSGPIILVCLMIASFDTKSFGLFTQKRIGRFAKPFVIYKIKTLHDRSKTSSHLGTFLRATKIDELPQLINILNGTMSFVGPRPDISGYADKLNEKNRIILNLRPGFTGLASLKYRHEEQLLSLQQNPLQFNDTIIWPDKVRINKWYAEKHSLAMDLKIMFHTLFPLNFEVEKFIENTK